MFVEIARYLRGHDEIYYCMTATPHRHDTPFLEFIGLLFSPLAANVIGHPAWQFSPGYISVRAGQTVRATNAGGEIHTFTEVTAFGP